MGHPKFNFKFKFDFKFQLQLPIRPSLTRGAESYSLPVRIILQPSLRRLSVSA